jgi:hypothetical protein
LQKWNNLFFPTNLQVKKYSNAVFLTINFYTSSANNFSEPDLKAKYLIFPKVLLLKVKAAISYANKNTLYLLYLFIML